MPSTPYADHKTYGVPMPARAAKEFAVHRMLLEQHYSLPRDATRILLELIARQLSHPSDPGARYSAYEREIRATALLHGHLRIVVITMASVRADARSLLTLSRSLLMLVEHSGVRLTSGPNSTCPAHRLETLAGELLALALLLEKVQEGLLEYIRTR